MISEAFALPHPHHIVNPRIMKTCATTTLELCSRIPIPGLLKLVGNGMNIFVRETQFYQPFAEDVYNPIIDRHATIPRFLVDENTLISCW
jgi:hypothetical protein